MWLFYSIFLYISALDFTVVLIVWTFIFKTGQSRLCFVLCSSCSLCLWSGDGGVETAEEAVEPAEPDINELCTDMFDKMSVFLQGELTGQST